MSQIMHLQSIPDASPKRSNFSLAILSLFTGLGKSYALLLASRGASVVVNDLGGSRSGEGQSSKAADLVVNEIRKTGGNGISALFIKIVTTFMTIF